MAREPQRSVFTTITSRLGVTIMLPHPTFYLGSGDQIQVSERVLTELSPRPFGFLFPTMGMELKVLHRLGKHSIMKNIPPQRGHLAHRWVSCLEMQNISQRELRESVSSGHQQSRLVALIHTPACQRGVSPEISSPP